MAVSFMNFNLIMGTGRQTCSLNNPFHQEAGAALAPRRGTVPGTDVCLFWPVSSKLIQVSLLRVVEF
jgi:hypothetical protein